MSLLSTDRNAATVKYNTGVTRTEEAINEPTGMGRDLASKKPGRKDRRVEAQSGSVGKTKRGNISLTQGAARARERGKRREGGREGGLTQQSARVVLGGVHLDRCGKQLDLGRGGVRWGVSRGGLEWNQHGRPHLRYSRHGHIV
jgi:hypothetical protein